MQVHIRPAADADLGSIFDWIAAEDVAAAERLIERIADAARRLGDFPERGRQRPEIGEGVRSLVLGRYLILYRVTPRQVEVVRIVHGARELGGLLGLSKEE